MECPECKNPKYYVECSSHGKYDYRLCDNCGYIETEWQRLIISKDGLAKQIADYLWGQYHRGSFDAAYVDREDLSDVIIDGHVNLIELAEVILGAIGGKPKAPSPMT